jgi:cell division septation protein DedD
MSDFQRDRLELTSEDEDRLPWLEPVDDYEDEEGISIARLIGAVVVGLVALGLVIGGIFWLRNREASGDGTLITAPAGPIKEKPGEAGGMEVEGSGDAAYTASVGQEVNSTIDLSALPEAPVTDTRPVQTAQLPPSSAQPAPAPAKPAPPAAAPAKPAPPAKKPEPAVATAQIPASAAKPAPKPAVAPKQLLPETALAPSTGGGGGSIQLGAFGSEAGANKAWSSLSGRFGFLSGLGHSVNATTVNGKTLYRLRAGAGGQASSICAKLKVAGEAGSVVN